MLSFTELADVFEPEGTVRQEQKGRLMEIRTALDEFKASIRGGM